MKQGACVAESDCFLFRVPRADCMVGSNCAAPARVGRRRVSQRGRGGVSREVIAPSLAGAGERSSPGKREAKESLRPARGEWTEEIFQVFFARVGRRKFSQAWLVGQDKRDSKRGTRANRITDSSGSRGGAGSPNEGKQKAFVPPPAGRAGRVPREIFRGKCRIPPACFASRGGSCPFAAERVARLWAPPAPSRRASRGSAGGGLPRFCRLHHAGPLRPGIMNILRNTLNSGVFHMNLPGQPLRIQRYLASHPA